ncbi:MAG: filamentous hemagglutinin N-terminal domain-containing protein, partial [Okeania sp. SIO3I5]|nr:filamentous hemagglutinin N-terminal domain-containing protein [Okeania sp. SIO3I5]
MSLLAIAAATPAKSQPITPANDGTGTTVTPQGNEFNIEGGTRSGANLFHSFEQFNVNSGQTANFLTTPDTSNILGRVTGGNASIINGLIQVIGGNSNLFLMNPTGIIFGPNASLNVPASFSVTTATGIGFDNNNFWFQAMGTNDYSNLVGNPSGYRFNVSNPGAIVNEGNLSLNPGENLTLLGGTVVNTGELSTAGGNITIAAVEGESILRISQPGNLLSLEVEAFQGTSLENGENTDITPLSLPQLLTGGEETHASSVIVNANGDVVLTDSNTLVADTPGTAITSANIDVSTTSTSHTSDTPHTSHTSHTFHTSHSPHTPHTSFQEGYNIGGQVNILGDRVALIDTNINADGLNGGGTVLIGGDFQGNGIVPNSQQTFVNNNSFISADAINNGDGGRVIIWSDGITNFAGNISAKGGDFSGDGGFVEVSGKQELIFDGSVDVSAAFGNPGTILLDPENITVGEDNSETESETEGDNSEVSATENSENSETETVEDNSEVSATENSENSETETVEDNSEVSVTENSENSENSETETEGDNSEVSATENSENSDSETVENNSEVSATENSENLDTTENTNNSETETLDNNSEVPSTENENTDSPTTEIADNSETTKTETPIDPFAQDENSDVTISAENLGELSGDVILLADNDITINEKIETDSSVELKAGRSININADIDTSVGNGNIDLLGNNDEMNIANRSNGKASINQLDGTTLNSGSGTINIELGNLGEVGDINLASLTTTGEVFVNANGGNIARVSDSSTINAGSVLFQTSGTGGIGLIDAPLQLNVENLEAVSGSGGVFFDVGNVNIGDVSEDVDGIATAGGDIEIQSTGNVTLTEAISTIETVENNSEAEISRPSQGGSGGIESTEVTDTNAAINIEATGDIVATGSRIKGGGENVSLSATNIRINDEFEETSGDADIKLEATNDITVEDIEDDVLEFLPGEGEIEFLADVDGDGIGIVEMLDNEADVGNDPNTFTNGADTIKTNGRNLTIAGAEIILGNIDTSWLPIYSGGELLAAIDVDEGGSIPPKVEDKSEFIPFDFTTLDFSALERDSDWNFIIDGKPYYIAFIEGQNYFVPIRQILNDTATFTFTVDNDLGNVENLDVRFSVEHSTVSNLEVNLESPEGKEVNLFSRVGGNEGRNFQDTVLDDDASRGINFGNAPLNRTYSPQGSLADFNGENSTGTWTLKVRSFFLEGDSGTLYKAGETTPWGTALGTQLLLRNPLVQSGGGRGSGNSGAVNLDATHGDLSVGNIRSFSETGNGGRVDLKANNNIITGLINSASRQGNGGAINLNAISGNILTYSLDASSVDGDGGNIEIEAAGDITTADIATESGEFFVDEYSREETNSGRGNAGNISIESTAGAIITEGSLKARSVSGNGANVEIKALQDISTAGITTESEENAGDISIESKEGAINIQAELDASSVVRDYLSSGGDGGNIEIKAAQDISTAGITTESDLNSGNITIKSKEGTIDTTEGFGFTIASSLGENGGNVEIKAAGDISTGYVSTGSYNKDAGNITIKSTEGAIAADPASGTIDAGGTNNGGNVEIKAADDITTTFINTYSQNGNAGNITIESTEGAIDMSIGSILASSFNGNGNGGNVEIKAAGDVTTTSIFTDSGAFTISQPVPGSLEFLTGTNGGSGNAGNITINSTAGSIDTTVGPLGLTEGSLKARSVLGNGGNITLTAEGDIITQQVESFSSSMSERNLGNGGDITMTAGGDIINTVWLDSSFADTSSSGNNLDRDNSGNAGNITLSAGGDIIAGWLVLYSWVKEGNSGDGGDINLNAEGNINTYSIDAYSFTQEGNSGDGGSITLNARGDINLNTNEPEFSFPTGFLAATGVPLSLANEISNIFEQEVPTLDRKKLAIRTFSTGTNDSGNGGDVNIITNNLSNTEIFTLSSDSQSGQVTIESQPQGNLLLNDLSIITSQQLSIPNRVNTQETEQNPFVGPLKVDAGTQGQSGDVFIISNGNLNLNNVTIESDTKGEQAAGNVNITSLGNITLDSTNILSITSADGNAGNITLETDQNILFTNSSRLQASTEAIGNAGSINIQASSLNLDQNTSLITETTSAGNPGSITIQAQTIDIGEDAQISATVVIGSTSTGDGGKITINTNELNITGQLGIFAETEASANAGTLTISPYENNQNLDINFSNDGFISASTSSTGNGGNIFITAPENIDISGEGSIAVETSGTGNAGIIDIETDNLTISNGVAISASTEDKGNAGQINVNTKNFTLEKGTSLTTETNDAGKAGDIEINTRQVTIGEDAQISATAREGATNTEAGGNITINANDLLISGRLGIFAETAGESPAGILRLQPYKSDSNLNITFTEQGFISARTTATGDGGNINIFAPENINISGVGKISVETTGSGGAGSINIQTENLTLSEQVAISAETNSSGAAGNILINSQTVTIGEGTEITATAKKEATSTEDGGNITINTNDLLISGKLGIFAETEGKANAGTLILNPYREVGTLHTTSVREQVGTLHATSVREFEPNLNITFTENGFISARTLSSGDGGDINIFAPENINISGEGRITVETTGAGNAGIINIEAENLTITENTTISAATSDSGDGGSIDISTNQTFQLEGQILTETTGTGNGGAIAINTGEFIAPNSTISAKSTDAGNAGTIDITAQENITTGIISSQANNQNETADGGNIAIASERGEINATQPIQSFSETANAGDVTLTAQNDITTDTISSHGQKQGGEITIKSETGNIDTSNSEFIANYSGGGDAGNVTLTAPEGNISTNNIYSFADGDGGEISLKAGGDINIKENSNIISASEPPNNSSSDRQGKGGDIILEAGNNINTTTAEIYSGADIGDTGKIDMIADGAIETGEINLASGFVRDRVTVNENFTLIPIPGEEATQGVAGNITLRSNNSTIDTTAGTINSRSPDGTGNITLNARDNITTGELEASALNESKPTTGGDVEIISQQGEINATQAIQTFSRQGTAGNVDMTAESHIHIDTILSQGMEQGGNITINSRSENSIDAAGELNTFSDAGIAGDVTLTSPGSINISGIRSEGMEQGGNITVNSEIGEINSTGDIDSFSQQGIGGNVAVNAPESVTLANVSSFGMAESGNLIIESSQAQVNTGDVTTQAPAGSSGSIFINGTEVGTGDLRSIGTSSAGEINVEATDGSIATYDITMSSDGTIGTLTLRSSDDTTTGDISQDAGEGDANIDIESGGDQDIGNIDQTAEAGDTNNIQTAEGDQNIGNVTQIAGGDTNNIQTAEGNQNIGNVTQTAGGDTNNIQTAEGNQNIGNVTQTAGGDTNNIQTAEGNQNIGNVTQTAGGDTNNFQIAGGNQNIGNVTQTAGGDTNNFQTAGGNQNIGNVTQTAGGDTNNFQTAGGNQNIGNVTQTAGGDTNNIQIPGNEQNLGQIDPTFSNESINIQLPEINQNPDNTSVISNNNNTNINLDINQTNPQNNNSNILNNFPNNTTTNSVENNTSLISNTAIITSTITPSNNNQTSNTATAKEQTDESINNTTDTQQILKAIDTINTNPLTVATGSDQIVTMLEENRIKEYSDYFEEDFNEKLVNT